MTPIEPSLDQCAEFGGDGGVEHMQSRVAGLIVEGAGKDLWTEA